MTLSLRSFFFRLLVARKETFLAVLFIYSYGSKSKAGAFVKPSLNQRVVKTLGIVISRMNRHGAIDRSETRDRARAIRVSRGLLMRLRYLLSSPSFPLSKVIITRRKLVSAREARRKTEDCLPRPNRTGFQPRESAAGSSVHNKFYYRLRRSQFTCHLNDALMRPT